MENQDKETNKPHPKPSDDAQSLVETIIPSSQTEESKTTEVKPGIGEKVERKKETQEVEEENEATAKPEVDDIADGQVEKTDAKQEKNQSDEGDKIETVAP